MSSTWQQPLPDVYVELSEPELRVRIDMARAALGKRLVILGHHYQQDSIIDYADFVGDSYELSRRAADQKGIEYVIFGGVHFMAESADILTAPSVQVILPDLGAGCSMADMANLEQTEECWAHLQATCPDHVIVPITYMNSSAAIKAFVGEHGGAVCTSSNCRKVLDWAFAGGGGEGRGEDGGVRRDEKDRMEGKVGRREQDASSLTPHGSSLNPSARPLKPVKILFFPDQHLGRNTAYGMGIPLDQMTLWDPRREGGGNDAATLQASRVILWKGHCSVHSLFRPEHIDQVRAKFPDAKVIVHPECRWEVVQKADLAGSTKFIVDQITAAPPGTRWVVGTEVHLVNRLKNQFPQQHISVLSDCQCLCTTMYRIDLPHLCWVLENLEQGIVLNRIKVDDHTRKWSLVALERMLAIHADGNQVRTAALESVTA